MRDVCLFIAMSLDGYIADSTGGVDWLHGQGDEEYIDSYSEFAETIDSVLMGWNTYHQITTKLSPEAWVYGDFTTYVFTHGQCTSSESIRFVDVSPADIIEKLKRESGKGIWTCGGADLVQQLVSKDLIDRYYITMVPILLGSGIRLFGNTGQKIELRLLDTRSYNGMVDLLYERR